MTTVRRAGDVVSAGEQSSLRGTGLRTASMLVNGDFAAGLDGWTWSQSDGDVAPGQVYVDAEQAVMQEGDSFLVTLQQTFTIPANTLTLSFELVLDPGFDLGDDFIPDAFEATLLDQDNWPVVPPWDILATSFFNMQEDGTDNLGSATTWDGLTAAVDVSGVAPDTVVTLYFDFIGADADTAGGIRLDNVAAAYDCNTNGIPDNQDIADCPPEDPSCQDCNDNGVPDGCDISGPTSEDANGNGIPDECDPKAPVDPPYPHNRQKNRYVSFGPNKAGNDGLSVAFKVELTSLLLGSCDGSGDPTVEGWPCRTDDDCRACSITGTPCITAPVDCEPQPPQTCDLTGAICVNDQAGSVGYVWWVGSEHPALGNDVHLLVSEPYRKVSDDWPDVVHVADCEIVPIATYEVRAVNVDTLVESDALDVRTVDKPDRWWADCIGPLDDHCTGNWAPCTGDGDCPTGETCIEQWPPPDGFTNFHDATAAVFAFQQIPGITLPAIMWSDLHGNDAGDASVDPPNYVVNFADIANIIAAFQGRPYPYSDPGDCPDVDAWP